MNLKQWSLCPWSELFARPVGKSQHIFKSDQKEPEYALLTNKIIQDQLCHVQLVGLHPQRKLDLFLRL